MKSPSLECGIRIPTTANWKILRAAVLMASLSFVAKLGSTAKELVVAHQYGRGDVLDAFLIALMLPSFCVTLVAASFNAALIPTFVQVRDQKSQEAAQRLLSSVMVWSVGLLVGVALVLGLLAPYYLPLLASGFGPSKLMLTRRLLYFLLPYVVLSGVVVNLTAVLNAGEKFGLPAFTPIVTPLVVVIFIVVSNRLWGILSLALGTIVGTSAEAAILAYTLKAQGMSLRLRWPGMDAHMRQVMAQYLPMVAGAFLMSGTNLVDQAMAAMLAPGSVAALGYGNKVTAVVCGTCTAALGAAVLPYFSQMAGQQDWDALCHTLRTYLRLIGLVATPIAVGLVIFSRPLVRLLFQRGAFTAADSAVVSAVQAMYAIQIPFYASTILLGRLVSALKRNDVLLKLSSINLALDVVLNLTLMRFLGVAGIALSTSLFYVASFLYLSYWVVKLAGQKRRRDANTNDHEDESC